MLATIISFAQVCKTSHQFSKKCYRLGNIFCYTSGMEYITVVVDAFWAIMEYIVPVITPVIAILLIFSIIKGLLFHER